MTAWVDPREAVRQAVAILGLEGYEPGPFEQVLNERFARSEIDGDQYLELALDHIQGRQAGSADTTAVSAFQDPLAYPGTDNRVLINTTGCTSSRCTHFVKATAAPRKPFCGSSRGRPGHEIDHTKIDKAPWNAREAATHGGNFEPMQGRVRRRDEPVACRRVRSVAQRSGRASCSRSCVWCSRSSGGRPRSPHWPLPSA